MTARDLSLLGPKITLRFKSRREETRGVKSEMSKRLDDLVVRALTDDEQEVVLDREGLRAVRKPSPTEPTPRPVPAVRTRLAPTVD